MKTIIFIGTNKSGSSRDAINAAEQLGYFTVVFTNNEKQLQQRAEYTDVHEMIFLDTASISAMKKVIIDLKSKGKDIKLVVSFIDSFVHTASVLCDEFCHNYSPIKAIEIMEDKEKTRESLKNHTYTPKFFVVKPGETPSLGKIKAQLGFPVIVKSPTSTGSKDVLFASTRKQIKKHIAKLRKKGPDKVIILEEYIEGDQYLVEALVYNNEVQVAAILKQEITQGKRFIITGYGVLAEVPSELMIGITKVLYSVVTELGIENGALHLELRQSINGWKLIEVNPRISGGAMNKMIHAAFGFNLVSETLKLYLGEIPSLKPRFTKYVFTHYMISTEKGILEKVTGKGRARKSPGVIEVFVKPRKGTLLIPPLSMGHRYAFIIATGPSLEEAKEFAINAANQIKFHLAENEVQVEDQDEDEFEFEFDL